MRIPASDIKSLLVTNGLHDAGTSGDDLWRIAQEISGSIKGIENKQAIAQTVYGSLIACGIDFTEVDNLMKIAENIANTITTSPYIE